MKLILLALCILPAVISAPDKRIIGGLFGGNASSIFASQNKYENNVYDKVVKVDLATLKCDVQLMLDVIGSDPTEVACESECHTLLQQGHVLNYACPLVCKMFQSLAGQWHLVPETTDPSVNPCQHRKK